MESTAIRVAIVVVAMFHCYVDSHPALRKEAKLEHGSGWTPNITCTLGHDIHSDLLQLSIELAE